MSSVVAMSPGIRLTRRKSSTSFTVPYIERSNQGSGRMLPAEDFESFVEASDGVNRAMVLRFLSFRGIFFKFVNLISGV